MELFEKSSRIKLRFDTERGQLSAEDLWDLQLTSNVGKINLDDIAKKVYKQIKDSVDVASFVDEAKPADTTLQLQFDIVKYVIDVKKAERASANEAKDKADRKQLILGIIAQKENDTLAAMDTEELKKQLALL